MWFYICIDSAARVALWLNDECIYFWGADLFSSIRVKKKEEEEEESAAHDVWRCCVIHLEQLISSGGDVLMSICCFHSSPSAVSSSPSSLLLLLLSSPSPSLVFRHGDKQSLLLGAGAGRSCQPLFDDSVSDDTFIPTPHLFVFPPMMKFSLRGVQQGTSLNRGPTPKARLVLRKLVMTSLVTA